MRGLLLFAAAVRGDTDLGNIRRPSLLNAGHQHHAQAQQSQVHSKVEAAAADDSTARLEHFDQIATDTMRKVATGSTDETQARLLRYDQVLAESDETLADADAALDTPDTSEDVVENAGAAGAEIGGAKTVNHFKEAGSSPTKEATAPPLDDEVVGLVKDVQTHIDGTVEELMQPSQAELAWSKHLANFSTPLLLGFVISHTYLVMIELAYLMLCGIVWAFLCMGQRRAKRTVTKADFSGDFAPVGLFACMTSPVTAVLETICCPHFLWAETVGKLDVVPFWMALGLVVLLLIVVPTTNTLGFLVLGLPARAAVRTFMRRSYRQAANTQGRRATDCCLDMVVQLLCCPCAVAQEAQFVELHQQAYGKESKEAPSEKV